MENRRNHKIQLEHVCTWEMRDEVRKISGAEMRLTFDVI